MSFTFVCRLEESRDLPAKRRKECISIHVRETRLDVTCKIGFACERLWNVLLLKPLRENQEPVLMKPCSSHSPTDSPSPNITGAGPINRGVRRTLTSWKLRDSWELVEIGFPMSEGAAVFVYASLSIFLGLKGRLWLFSVETVLPEVVLLLLSGVEWIGFGFSVSWERDRFSVKPEFKLTVGGAEDKCDKNKAQGLKIKPY